jgi:hypothetical protein
MPRNGSGTMSLTTAFVPSTPALAADVNTVLGDIAAEITNSVAKDGQTPMTGQFKAADGTITAPGLGFGSDTNTGFYRSASGVIRASCDGTNSFTISATGVSTPILTATTSLTVGAVANAHVPAGAILMWSGSVASIPTGWLLCNGSNGTPDLRNRFIVGAGSTYAVAATGGSADAIAVSHTHTATSAVTDPGHTHTKATTDQANGYVGGTIPQGGFGSRSAVTTDSAETGISVATTVNSAGSPGTNANLPPYYALAFIMKA